MTDSPVAKWSYEIDQYDRRMQVWHKRGKKIIKRYADERSGVSEERSNRYNALWSNVQTMLPAMYSRLPKPDIQRRFRDSDDVGRVSSDVLQRVSQFNLQSTGAHDALRHAVLEITSHGKKLRRIMSIGKISATHRRVHGRKFVLYGVRHF
jgi:hypothetical protein